MSLRIAIIIVLGLVAYGPMLPAPFRVMDDRLSIVENPAIKSIKNVPRIFGEGYFHDQSYYRPLVNLSFMGEYHFFGLNPFFYNLDNLILHICNALLVFCLVSRLVNSDTVGFWTGLLFAIHPVQWEAVCNVPGRSILLSVFFVLSSFILFLEAYKNGRTYFLILALVAFFLGLLCKESAGMLGFVVAAYLSLDQTKTWPQKLKYLWPFVIGTAGYLLLRVNLGITDIHQADSPMALGLGFVTFLRSLITDLRLFVLPVDLHYDRCLPVMVSLKEPLALATCFFWGAALGFFIIFYRKFSPFALFLIAWFGLELLPVAQLVSRLKVGAYHLSTAEHFLYLACVPVFISMVMVFRCVKWPLSKFLAGGFLVFLLLTTIEQSIYASNETAMIDRSLSFEPNNPRVQSARAMLSVFKGDTLEAEMHFRMAIKNDPFNPTYHVGLGTNLCQQARWIEGLEQFVAFDDPGKDKALVEAQEKLTMIHIRQQLNEGKNIDARGWLAIGIYYAKTGQSGQAIDAFQKSVSLNPQQTDAWFNLGSLDEASGNHLAAMAAYKRLLELHDLTDFQKEYVSKHYVEFYHR